MERHVDRRFPQLRARNPNDPSMVSLFNSANRFSEDAEERGFFSLGADRGHHWTEEIDVASAGRPPLSLSLPAGSLFVHRSELPMALAPHDSAAPQRAILLRYVKPEAKVCASKPVVFFEHFVSGAVFRKAFHTVGPLADPESFALRHPFLLVGCPQDDAMELADRSFIKDRHTKEV